MNLLSSNRYEPNLDDRTARFVQADLVTIQALILQQSQQLTEQQQHIQGLAILLSEMINANIRQQQQSDLNLALTNINENIDVLSKALVALHKKVDKANLSQELSALKSEQQALTKSVDITYHSISLQAKQLATHLDWKRTAIVITIAVVICSLYSVGIGQLIGKTQSGSRLSPIPQSAAPTKGNSPEGVTSNDRIHAQ